jgi:hypothetical protein
MKILENKLDVQITIEYFLFESITCDIKGYMLVFLNVLLEMYI